MPRKKKIADTLPEIEETKAAVVKKMTPSNIATELQVSNKLNSYEIALNELETAENELEAFKEKANKFLQPFHLTWSPDYSEHNLTVYIKQKVDKKIKRYANLFGSQAQNITYQNFAEEVKELIGEKAFNKLQEVSKQYASRNRGFKDVDEAASEKAWAEYQKMVTQHQELAKRERYARAKISKANNFVSYANSLADIAKKTTH